MREITKDGREIFIYYGSSICLVCKHYISDVKCKAYPNKIPDEIYSDASPRKHCSQNDDFTFEIVDKYKEYYDKFYDKDGNRKVTSDEKKKKREGELSQTKKCVEVLKYIISKLTELDIKPDLYKILKMLYFADRVHLLRYGYLIAPNIYLKMEHGPVPSLCYSIIQFVRGDKYPVPFDESIKEEFEVQWDEEISRRTKLKLLEKQLDLSYLSETNIKCLDAAIAKYGRLEFDELKEKSHDEIYKSVNDRERDAEITIDDMLNILDNDEKFAEKCSAGF
jgi:uncharacterized phage-associated protein